MNKKAIAVELMIVLAVTFMILMILLTFLKGFREKGVSLAEKSGCRDSIKSIIYINQGKTTSILPTEFDQNIKGCTTDSRTITDLDSKEAK